MDIAYSVDGVPVRLTAERWLHIVENHDDLAGYYEDILATIEDPDVVLSGQRNSRIAVKSYGRKRYLAVIYRQTSKTDGFVITAFFTDRIDRKKALWKK
jgi:hypothetical protein